MPIIRSRTGCFTCRRRKKKCNEEKPICSGCRRNRLECTWPTENNNLLQVRGKGTSNVEKAAGQQDQPKSQEQHHPRPPPASHHHPASPLGPAPYQPIAASPPRPRTESSSSSGSHHGLVIDTEMAGADDGILSHSPAVQPVSPALSRTSVSAPSTGDPTHEEHDPIIELQSQALTLSNSLANIPESALYGLSTPMSLLPSHGHDSFELLSYYLTRTANSMGNGSTDINPFIAKLVPLAFSNPLVLQLLLAQSASHRQSAESAVLGNEVAHQYYTDSLRMFRNVVTEYVSGKDENTLVLTVGSLILSLTEVARGDVNGTVFDHLRASESMLNLLLSRPKWEISDDLPDFLVEFAMHMTVTSMISTDPKHKAPVLSGTIETLARGLVNKGYVGQLCGCWLELLLLIPQVYHLGQRMMSAKESSSGVPMADDIISFGLLQSQIMAFYPDHSVNPYSRLAGLVFKQGVLLYLWSMLDAPHSDNGNNAQKSLMSTAVAEAVSLLDQFPATLRINTSLCWPLAVIGCCTVEPETQQMLRNRLQTMHTTIGLGNMKQTLALLEHIWNKPPEQISPWKLSEVMQEHQIWISFA